MISDYIDHQIKDLFGLFKDPQQKERDTKLYAQIFGAIHDEMIRFLEDHLSKKELEILEDKIAEIEQKEGKPEERLSRIYPLILLSLVDLPDHNYRLYKRIDYFVSNLYLDTVNKKRRKGMNGS